MKLSVPSVLEQTLFMVVGVVSTILVGWIGKEAISAVGLINTLVNFVMVLFVALSTGSTVLVARLVGEDDWEKARDAMKQSLMIAAAASVLVSILCFVFALPIIRLLFSSAEPIVVDYAAVYFRITLYTFPFTLVNIMISGCLRGAGDTRTPMIIAYVVNIINIALGYVLIRGLHTPIFNFDGFGMTGAAWAVAISRGVGGTLSVIAVLRSGSLIRVRIFEKFHLNMSLMKRMFNVGIPAALEQVVMQGGFLVLQMVISGMGTSAIAVYQIGMSINSICYIPIWGFGTAATTLVGQSLGAQKPEIAEKSGWETLKISMVLTVVLGLGVFVFARQLVGIYSTDSDVLKIGTAAIRIFSLSQPFLSAVVVISNGLRGAGDITYVMVTSFVGIWVFRVLVTYILGYWFGMGIMGVWIALCLDFLARSVMYVLRFRKGRWKSIVV